MGSWELLSFPSLPSLQSVVIKTGQNNELSRFTVNLVSSAWQSGKKRALWGCSRPVFCLSSYSDLFHLSRERAGWRRSLRTPCAFLLQCVCGADDPLCGFDDMLKGFSLGLCGVSKPHGRPLNESTVGWGADVTSVRLQHCDENNCCSTLFTVARVLSWAQVFCHVTV